MPPAPPLLDVSRLAALGKNLGGFFDPDWYAARYPDVLASGTDPLTHFLNWGGVEGRDPNRWFDSAWYAAHYPDVVAAGVVPLLHYMVSGAAEHRNPHPRFDAEWYADQHPEASANPLLHHLLFGAARGWFTEKSLNVADYLPSGDAPLVCPRNVNVDVIVPAYRGLAETQRCIGSVLADRDRPAGRIIIVDDASPEPALSAWLARLAADDRIVLLRNPRNLGFVASVNRGIEAAGDHDVALLNSDTEVPEGWLRRLAAQAYADRHIASVSPFSNNATICSYPRDEGGPLPLGQSLATLDTLCRTVNAGRSVDVPTTVGFCMYIRRAALDAVGAFDEAAFGRGYGEENDFCLRAAKAGWRHVLACDTFVYHEGSVSFGTGAGEQAALGMDMLTTRYPGYARTVNRHVNDDAVGPFRFAVTAALFRQMGLPVVLMLSHGLGGGVQRHIDTLTERLRGRANVLLLEASSRGAALLVPSLHGRPVLDVPGERLDELVRIVRSAAVSRVHVHHLMRMDLDARALIHRLGVPFDVTVHDYLAICPQVNLLPWPAAHYCGEPGPAGCNACIADRPSHGARDITSWRRTCAWQFMEAERVICPSEDTRARLARHGLADRTIVVPHEPVAAGPWPLNPPPMRGRKLRVAVLGVLAEQKGAQTVLSVLEMMDPAAIELHLIGHPESRLPPEAEERIEMTGEYDDADLPALLARVKPHLVWFPAQWPETYSYTLSAAIDAGLPIVATRIGSFIERLNGRPWSWMLDPRAPAEEWLRAFEQVRTALSRPRVVAQAPDRPAVADFYADAYLQPPAVASVIASEAKQSPARKGTHRSPPQVVPPAITPVDLRRPGRLSIVLVPERLENGALSPCAYIRLLQPLDHPAIAEGFDIVLADAAEALRYRADVVATQRYAIPDAASAEALAAHCHNTGAVLLYDMDDDLPHIPKEHPDAAELRPRTKVVRRMLRLADAVWVSTPALAATLTTLRQDVRVVPNGLDERLWTGPLPLRDVRGGPVRILCMGTATHDADFGIIEPALARLQEVFDTHVSIDMLGVSTRADLPKWLNRPSMPVTATASYPGFVHWMTRQPAWDIGLAPLADTAFNRGKSAIKTLDYAALGMAVVASDTGVYRGSLADGPCGMLAANDPGAWFVTLCRLVRDDALRRALGQGALEAFRAGRTLASQAAERRAAWLSLVTAKSGRNMTRVRREKLA
jgi:GT2 family glycosyltransferase/glycosyltransferase involved in cell wall biosynthesis